MDNPSGIIRHHRSILMVNSYLYYALDNAIMLDGLWQNIANELVLLQDIYGVEHDFYDDDFRDWDGATGMHLPAPDWVVNKALELIAYERDLNINRGKLH
jgi:hypothetical protein